MAATFTNRIDASFARGRFSYAIDGPHSGLNFLFRLCSNGCPVSVRMLNTKQTEKTGRPRIVEAGLNSPLPQQYGLLDDGCYPDGSTRRADARLAPRSNGEDRHADGSILLLARRIAYDFC